MYADPGVLAVVRERFGEGVVGAGGTLDRAALGALAFADPDGLPFLERLVHGRVGRRRREWIGEQLARPDRPALLVCEVPVLFEAGLEDQFDAVLVVTASDAVRRARVAARGQDFDARSARQVPEAEKVARADRAYVNDGSLEALRAWVADRYAEYAGRPCGPPGHSERAPG